MSLGARSPASSCSGCWRQDVDAEDRGQGDDQDRGRDRQPRRVVAGEAGEGRRALGQHRLVSGLSGSRRRGPTGRPGRAPGRRAADDLAVGPAAGPRREPAHDLAQVAGGGGAGRARCASSTRAWISASVSGLGQVLGEDVDLGLFLGREVLAARALRYASTDSRRVLTSRVRTARNSSSVSGRCCASRRCRRRWTPCAGRRGAANHRRASRR